MKKFRFIACLMYILVFFPMPVYAYIDPGTGSMIIQAAAAIILGAGVAFRVYWNKIKLFLAGNKKTEESDDKIKEGEIDE